MPNFTDLVSINQLGQRFQSLGHLFYSDRQNYSLLRGTQFTWSVRGGSNFWQDYQDGYAIDLTVEPQTELVQVKRHAIIPT